MFNNKSEQKLISFLDTKVDLDEVTEDMRNGWVIISLIQNGNYYMGIMERKLGGLSDEDKIYLPPIKKIKLALSRA